MMADAITIGLCVVFLVFLAFCDPLKRKKSK